MTKDCFSAHTNSTRSQMAKGLLCHLAGDLFGVASGGRSRHGCTRSIRMMDEVGIDLGTHTSKTLDRFLGQPWDYVISIRDSAAERDPILSGRRTRLHWSFEDPSVAPGSEDERLKMFCRIRDEIAARGRAWVLDQALAKTCMRRPGESR